MEDISGFRARSTPERHLLWFGNQRILEKTMHNNSSVSVTSACPWIDPRALVCRKVEMNSVEYVY